ncbi:MAG: SUMF1/EgtB/PvdO family nonheme iron enzyme [Saprospiraceae bacterium]|nr:SUMF1/EgtB/PvdO family nonheme iron enzyme [Saprospiraceae bacterium]
MKHRYPGIHSFTADEQGQFFGREREKKELFRLISLHEVVVVFGKSGTGKTSLMQAGVGPLLSERRMQPLKIRLNNTQQSISRQLYEQFNDGEYLPYNAPDDLRLWEYCKLFEYAPGGERHSPVLLLDQFEELFTLYHDKPEARQDFIGQLAELLNHKPPARVQEAAQQTADENERRRLLAPPEVNVVISIRSDFLFLLDRLSGRIPSILRCRYELQALDEENTREAITRPPALPGAFASPLFSYSDAALEQMIDSLVNADEETAGGNSEREVEPFVAQMLCRFIEQKIIDEQRPVGFVVTPDFYGRRAGIQDIGKQYFEGVLDKFDADKRVRVERLLGDYLLSNDRRIIQERHYLLEKCGLAEPDLALLCSYRLLREEPRSGSFYYEISHDTLVGPIVEVREARELADAAARIAKEKADADRKRKRALVTAFIAGVLILVAAVSLVFAALKAKEVAEAEEKISVTQLHLKEAEAYAELKSNKASADSLLAEKKTQEADSLTIEALRLKTEAEKMAALAVHARLKEAREQVLLLDYPAADRTLIGAAALGVMQKEIGLAQYEILYWLVETENYPKADLMANRVCRLLRKPRPGAISNLKTGRELLKQLSPVEYNKMRERYYPTMIFIPGGPAVLGSEEGEENEKPLHSVTLSDFKLARTETTWWQYFLYCKATGAKIPEKPAGWGGEGDNPVINVSWGDAVAYTRWLNGQEGLESPIIRSDSLNRAPKGFRLPTEAEWEYAAGGGAGKRTKYAGTDDDERLAEYAWFGGRGRTQTAGALKPNALGLCDMSGNVWEWCWDWYGEDYYRQLFDAPQKDPAGPVVGKFRVCRGGSWVRNDYSCRSASRVSYSPSIRGSNVGFRVAQDK